MENKISKNKNKNWCMFLLSWVIPAVIILVVMAFIDAAPFGDKSIILRDAKVQYIDYVSYFKTVLLGENNLIYSFSKNLGGNMLSLAAYYLISPFNLLFVFSNTQNLPLIYTAVMILKLSACGATFFWALQNRYGIRKTHLVFSTAYALMAYNVIFQWNIMWLDGVIILPLLGLGVERIWQKKSPILYVLSLFYAMLTNFYIGYMLCVASVIFSVANFILFEGKFRDRCKVFLRYAISSLIGGLGAALVWLPTFLALQEGRARSLGITWTGELNFPVLQLCSKLVPGSGGLEQLANGLPHVFCGTGILFFVFAFFFSKKISKKIKLVSLGTLSVILIGFFFKTANVILHGFSPNISFNYRYSFIFSYIIIMIAQYATMCGIPKTIPDKIYAAVPLIAMYVFLLCKKFDYVQNIGIFIAVLVLVCLVFFANKINKVYLYKLALYFVILLEIGVNCFLLLDSIVVDDASIEKQQWNEYVEPTSKAVDFVKEHDESFYRMEKTFSRTHNDPMFFSYNGLSHFSSTEQAFVPGFLGKMGFKNHNYVWSYYKNGSTVGVDSFLGVKYVLSYEDLSVSKGYKLLKQVGDIGVYENENVLPIAMYSNVDIKNTHFKGVNLFDYQNKILQNISGIDDNVLYRINDYSITLINLQKSIDSSGNNIYTKINSAKEAALRFEIKNTKEMPIYFYCANFLDQSATLRVNGQDFGEYFDVYNLDAENIGVFKPGETIVFEIVPNCDSLIIGKELFYYEDLQAVKKATERIKTEGTTINKITSSYLEGTINWEKDGYLLLTIPYDNGWKIEVDGKPVEKIKVLDTFMAIKVDSGEHMFSLKYIPEGMYAGCLLSVTSLVFGTIYLLSIKKRIHFE